MTEQKSKLTISPNPMSGIYAMLFDVLQSITKADCLNDLLTNAFIHLRWIVNLDYCSTNFYRENTDDVKQGIIIANGAVNKKWQWQKSKTFDIKRAVQSQSRLIVEAKGDENNLFNSVFDEYKDLQQLLCFRLPVVDDEIVLLMIATKQANFTPQELNILNVFMEFLAVNIIKQRYTENLDHALSTLKNTQEQLIESEKMRALGSLVAGVAHEINTPLGVSITASSHLSEIIAKVYRQYESKKLTRVELDKLFVDVQELLGVLTRNLFRTTELVQDFKQVAVDQTSEQIREFELKEYLDEVIHSLRSKLKSGSHTVKLESEQNIVVNSYAGAIAQLMTNLILNSVQHAFKAMSSGTIHIKLTVKNKKVSIEYKDNGQGLDDKQREQVFEPFYTTARPQGGTGLGMSIGYNIATAKLRGKIDCVKCDHGAHFIISFPVDLA